MPRSFGTTNAAPYATAPPVGPAGDTYFNTTSRVTFVSDGAVWISSSPVDEVWVGPNAPLDSLTELWYDNDAVPPAPGGAGAAPEVFIGPDDPGTSFSLWYDTDAPTLVGGSVVDIEANRPATGPIGGRFFASDTKRWFFYDGSGWICLYEPTQNYVPTTTNISLGGSSVVAGRYMRRMGRCIGRVMLYMGASGTAAVMGTSPTFSVPFAVATDLSFTDLDGGFNAMYYDATGPRYYGTTYQAAGLNLGLQAFGGSVGAGATVSATVPFTWAFGDYIAVKYDYQMNNPYS
jgi:hypothetical protein